MSEWHHGLTELPPKRTAAPVTSRDGGIKKTTEKVSTKTYTAISLLDKWRLAQEIFADPKLSSTAKVVAGVLLNCLNCRTGKCCPSLAYLGARIGRERRVISAAIAQLRQRGWLTRRSRRGSSIYHFAFDRLQQDGVQETASHEPADAQEPAYLDVQDSAHEDAQKTAHLDTENAESGNRTQGVIPAGYPSSLGAANGNQRERIARRTPLAEAWQPSENDVTFATRCGLREEAISREAIKFKNYYIGKGILMVDWDRTWQNWCIRAVEYAGARRTTDVQSRRSLVAGLLHTNSPDPWGQS
jgi:Helix-turn-helix domain